MILNIDFPNNLVKESLLEQKNIPCFVKLGSKFEIEFHYPFIVSGNVEGWERQIINDRSPSGSGGEYTHYSPSLISLAKLGSNKYLIRDLSIFNRTVGWCPIIKNCEPTDILMVDNEEEDDDIGRKP